MYLKLLEFGFVKLYSFEHHVQYFQSEFNLDLSICLRISLVLYSDNRSTRSCWYYIIITFRIPFQAFSSNNVGFCSPVIKSSMHSEATPYRNISEWSWEILVFSIRPATMFWKMPTYFIINRFIKFSAKLWRGTERLEWFSCGSYFMWNNSVEVVETYARQTEQCTISDIKYDWEAAQQDNDYVRWGYKISESPDIDMETSIYS